MFHITFPVHNVTCNIVQWGNWEKRDGKPIINGFTAIDLNSLASEQVEAVASMFFR